MAGKAILIVEAGATKTDWALVAGGEARRARTGGINVALIRVEDMLATALLAADELEADRQAVAGVRFYGAGLVSAEAVRKVDAVLKNVFPNASVACGSDLLAAAKASFGAREGIVAILGTGSNSGLYNGRVIVRNVRPGGFILGDEGGGCALGKAFIADWVKGLLPERVAAAFDGQYRPTYAGVVENVYGGGAPSAYLASFAPFILSLSGDEYIDALVERNIEDFIGRSLEQYDLSRHEVSFVGSFGLACRDAIERAAPRHGMRIGGFIADPMDALIENIELK